MPSLGQSLPGAHEPEVSRLAQCLMGTLVHGGTETAYDPPLKRQDGPQLPVSAAVFPSSNVSSWCCFRGWGEERERLVWGRRRCGREAARSAGGNGDDNEGGRSRATTMESGEGTGNRKAAAVAGRAEVLTGGRSPSPIMPVASGSGGRDKLPPCRARDDSAAFPKLKAVQGLPRRAVVRTPGGRETVRPSPPPAGKAA